MTVKGEKYILNNKVREAWRLLFIFGIKKPDLNRQFTIKPTQAIVIGFSAIIALGTILLMLPAASRDGNSIGLLNALFTSTSAVCVTGLVVVDTYTHWSFFGQVVILVLIQTGGLGFMTMATLLSMVLRRRISLRERLIIVEALNQYNLKGVVRLTRKILLGTFLFEGLGALALSLKFIPEFGMSQGIFKGIFHSVSAFCNAGFDLMGQKQAFSSFTSYTGDFAVNIVLIILIVIGGLGFAVWDDLYRTRSFRELQLHTKLVLSVTGLFLFTGFIFFLLVEYNNPQTLKDMGFGGKLLASLFQSVTPRTAGFNTIDQAGMRDASSFMTMIFMFIGGSPGSTAGGIKITTIGVIFFAVLSFSRGKSDTEMFKRRLNPAVVLKAFAIAFIGGAIIGIVTIIISVNEAVTFKEAFFEAVSGFGTVGLSHGITPGLTVISRIAIIISMFFGRIGVLTMALAFTTGGGKPKTVYKYKEDRVMVG